MTAWESAASPAAFASSRHRPELGHQLGKDGALACEGGPGESRHRIGSRLGEPEGVDPEGADDARVQALEVEQQDVVVETGAGVEDVAAGTASGVSGSGPDIARHPAAPMQAGQVEMVERGDGSTEAVHREPRHLGAAHGEVHQVRVLEDVLDQAAVLQVVAGQLDGILPVEATNLRQLVGAGRQALSPAEHGSGDVLELEALQRPEGGAQQVDPVEHHAPRNPGDPHPGRRLGLEDARPLRCAREREPEL